MFIGKEHGLCCYRLTVHFIRHGRTAANTKKLYLSYTDQSIIPEEKTRICELKAGDFFPRADMIFTSGLRRTKETAQCIYPGMDITCVPAFDELCFGRFELKSYEELQDDRDYRAWLASGSTMKIPGGESLEEFIARQKTGLHKALIQACDKKEISIVCHGGTIMALVSAYTKADYYDCMVGPLEGCTCQVSYTMEECCVHNDEGTKQLRTDDVKITHFCVLSYARDKK